MRLEFGYLRPTSNVSGFTSYSLHLKSEDNFPAWTSFKEVARKDCIDENGKKYGEIFYYQSTEDPAIYTFGFNEYSNGVLNSYCWSSNPAAIKEAFGIDLIDAVINNDARYAVLKKDVEQFLPEGYKFYGSSVYEEQKFKDHEFDPDKYIYEMISDMIENRLAAWSTNPRPWDLTKIQVRLCESNKHVYLVINKKDI